MVMTEKAPLLIGGPTSTFISGPSPSVVGGSIQPSPAHAQPSEVIGHLLEVLASAPPVGVSANELRYAAGGPQPFERAWHTLRQFEYVDQTHGGAWLLSRKGEHALHARRAPASEPASHIPQPVTFDSLRQQYVASQLARRELLRERAEARARAEEQARIEALRKEQSLAWEYLGGGALWEGWQIGPERQEGADNLLAVYPKLEDRPDAPHIRLWVDEAQGVLWMQVSNSDGEPTEYIPPGWDPDRVRMMLCWLLVPAIEAMAAAPSSQGAEDPNVRSSD